MIFLFLFNEGTKWGESGYVRVKMNMGTYGMCNIALYAYYPVIGDTAPIKATTAASSSSSGTSGSSGTSAAASFG
jgi:hypothetical protein